MAQIEPAVFYSWQDDLSRRTNRYFIQAALKVALRQVSALSIIARAPRLDEATKDMPGAPDIAATIFSKLDQAAAIVADVSLINNGAVQPSGTRSRPTPNPNVLVEVGYALKTLGAEKMILVVNTAYGPVEQLPFDLRPRRVLKYHLAEDSASKAEIRKALVAQLVDALQAILITLRARPHPIPDLPWREYLDRSLGPLRYEGDPVSLHMRDDFVGPDVVKLVEQGATELALTYSLLGHEGRLRPIIFYRSGTGFFHMPSDAIPTARRCYRTMVSAQNLTHGLGRDLVVRWRDDEGGRFFAVLWGHYNGYHVVRWPVPAYGGNFLRDQVFWQLYRNHRFSIRPIEVDTGASPPANFGPSEEVVEELWVSDSARQGSSYGQIPDQLIKDAGVMPEESSWLRLTRVWRWEAPPGGLVMAMETAKWVADLPPDDDMP